jgi:hypothetical protein|eukprot:SAG25_NODE_1123_length_3886_cov_1.894904_4_plen_88_part_00
MHVIAGNHHKHLDERHTAAHSAKVEAMALSECSNTAAAAHAAAEVDATVFAETASLSGRLGAIVPGDRVLLVRRHSFCCRMYALQCT